MRNIFKHWKILSKILPFGRRQITILLESVFRLARTFWVGIFCRSVFAKLVLIVNCACQSLSCTLLWVPLRSNVCSVFCFIYHFSETSFMAVTYTRISERYYIYIILEVISFFFVENTLRTSTIMLQNNVLSEVNFSFPTLRTQKKTFKKFSKLTVNRVLVFH